jgi:hypothetical protein
MAGSSRDGRNLWKLLEAVKDFGGSRKLWRRSKAVKEVRGLKGLEEVRGFGGGQRLRRQQARSSGSDITPQKKLMLKLQPKMMLLAAAFGGSFLSMPSTILPSLMAYVSIFLHFQLLASRE